MYRNVTGPNSILSFSKKDLVHDYDKLNVILESKPYFLVIVIVIVIIIY